MSMELKPEGTARNLEVPGRSTEPTTGSTQTEDLFRRVESEISESLQFERQWIPPQRVEALLARPDSEAKEILSRLSPETIEGYRRYLQEHIQDPRDEIRLVFSADSPVNVEFPLGRSQALEMRQRLDRLTGSEAPQP